MYQKFMLFIQAMCILGVSTAFFFSEKREVSESEKRKLTQWPQLSDSTYLSGAYFKGISNYVNDQFPKRDELLKMSNLLRYNMGLHFEDEIRLVVVQAGMEQVNVGIDTTQTSLGDFNDAYSGGMIIINGSVFTLNSGSTAVSPVFADMLNDYAKALPHVQVYSAVAPLSSAFIPDEQYSHLNSKNEATLLAIRDHLNTNVKFADVMAEMNAHRNEKLFFGTDHHWTAHGAYHAYVAFCKSAGLVPVDRSEMTYEKRGVFLGSLYDLTRDPSVQEHPDTLELFKPKVTTESIRFGENGFDDGKKCALFSGAGGYTCFISGDYPLEKITTSIKNGRKACVIKNSMGNAFVVYLVSHFEEIYVVDFRYSKHNLMTLINDNKVTDLIFGMGMYGAMSKGTIGMMRNLGLNKPYTNPKPELPVEESKADDIQNENIERKEK
jgi:hypothetical protein